LNSKTVSSSSSRKNHELRLLSGGVLIPGGSRDEDPAKAGLVGLYGQAWRTSGTAQNGRADNLDDLLESKAAHIETAGDDDSTGSGVGLAEGRMPTRCSPWPSICFCTRNSTLKNCNSPSSRKQRGLSGETTRNRRFADR